MKVGEGSDRNKCPKETDKKRVTRRGVRPQRQTVVQPAWENKSENAEKNYSGDRQEKEKKGARHTEIGE